MITLKCKMCGGSLLVPDNSSIAVCEYCGSKQSFSIFSEDKSRLLYEQANNYLSQGEYDKAESLFAQLVAISPNDSELYWDLALCRYGVTYVKDPKTAKYIPTCNRTHYASILQDKNYLEAIKLSNGDKQALYKSDAQIINSIQKGILTVSKSEKPFDIFISYKETDQNGSRTKDSVAAQKIYEQLVSAGYKVFFSRITLEDKVGVEYEPYIFAALHSSKVMLTISSSRENIESVWVKNEWSRFLAFRQSDSTKTILPLFFDMSAKELPEEFALITPYDMSEEGFEEELLRGIKKLIPLPIMRAEKKRRVKKCIQIIGSVAGIVVVAGTFIAIPGYLKGQKKLKAYNSALQLFDSGDYAAAAQAFTTLGDYKDSEEMVDNCSKQPDYDEATKLLHEQKYAEAAWAFGKLGSYKDSEAKKQQSEVSWRHKTAVVVVKDGYSVYSDNDYYYINANGGISAMNNGIAHKGISFSNHGEVVSLSMGQNIGVVYEDGYVYCAGITTEQTDAIKLSGDIHGGNILLHSDGSVSIVTQSENMSEDLDDWIKVTSQWMNVVDFEFAYDEAYQWTDNEAVVAVKADGTLCGYITLNPDFSYATTPLKTAYEEVLSKFSDVKCLKISTTRSPQNPLSIVALTNKGKLQTCINGVFEEQSAEDIVDVITTDKLLTSSGKVVSLNGRRAYGQDVVFGGQITGDEYYCISRSGAINGEAKYKTVVQPEWKSRLD